MFRLEGARFAVVLAETDVEGAGIAMRRISAAIDDDPACLGVGISWGATALETGDELPSIVERATSALDDAKRALSR